MDWRPEPLNPPPLDHETRETFITAMAISTEYILSEVFDLDNADELAWKFHEQLWELSWELEAYYIRYVQGYRAAG